MIGAALVGAYLLAILVARLAALSVGVLPPRD